MPELRIAPKAPSTRPEAIRFIEEWWGRLRFRGLWALVKPRITFNPVGQFGPDDLEVVLQVQVPDADGFIRQLPGRPPEAVRWVDLNVVHHISISRLTGADPLRIERFLSASIFSTWWTHELEEGVWVDHGDGPEPIFQHPHPPTPGRPA